MEFLTSIPWPGLRGVFEILVMAVGLYYIFLIFHGTRGAQVLTGLAVVLITLLTLTYVFHLDTLTWLLQRFYVYLAVALLIIFQPEIRRALAELGQRHIFANATEKPVLEEVVRSAVELSEGKIGALIAIERSMSTKAVEGSGTPIDSAVSAELLASIFFPHTPLHDGGVIIRGSRIVAAGCLFPLAQRAELTKALGTRHRAALGLSEETDALVVVVSEETGAVSVAYKGGLSRGLDEDHLRRLLTRIMLREVKVGDQLTRLRQNLARRRAAAARPAGEEEARAHGE